MPIAMKEISPALTCSVRVLVDMESILAASSGVINWPFILLSFLHVRIDLSM